MTVGKPKAKAKKKKDEPKSKPRKKKETDIGFLDDYTKGILDSFNRVDAMRVVSAVASGMSLDEMKHHGIIPIDCNPFVWELEFPEFKEAMDKARMIGAEVLADQTLAIADGYKESKDPILSVKARQWIAGTRDPRYAHKQQQAQQQPLEDMTTPELEERLIQMAIEIAKGKK